MCIRDSIRGLADKIVARRKFNDGQQARVENVGTLIAAGLIAGEALIGLLFAFFNVVDIPYKNWAFFDQDGSMLSFLPSLLVFVLVGWLLTKIPTANAGSPDEPAPPRAMT